MALVDWELDNIGWSDRYGKDCTFIAVLQGTWSEEAKGLRFVGLDDIRRELEDKLEDGDCNGTA